MAQNFASKHSAKVGAGVKFLVTRPYIERATRLTNPSPDLMTSAASNRYDFYANIIPPAVRVATTIAFNLKQSVLTLAKRGVIRASICQSRGAGDQAFFECDPKIVNLLVRHEMLA